MVWQQHKKDSGKVIAITTTAEGALCRLLCAEFYIILHIIQLFARGPASRANLLVESAPSR